MRVIPTLTALIFCAASFSAAHAQKANGESARGSNGMSFAYDALHGQINATGIQISPLTLKSNSVSPTTGTITVTINVKIVSHFESGTTYHCSVYAVGGEIDLATGTIDGGVENVNTFAPSSGATASCTLTVPYSWTLPAEHKAQTGLILAFGVGAINPESEVEHSTLQVDGIENLPANGSAATYVFNVAL